VPLSQNVTIWIHGLVAAGIGGLANAFLGWAAGLSARQYAIMTLGNILVTVGAYLKSSPDPWDPSDGERRSPRAS
jgi:hypothetical protein